MSEDFLASFVQVRNDDLPAGFDNLKPPVAASRTRNDKQKAGSGEVKIKGLRARRANQAAVMFSQRIPLDAAEFFYDYAVRHNKTMKDTLSDAAAALQKLDQANNV
jgi:hypothetical protein